MCVPSFRTPLDQFSSFLACLSQDHLNGGHEADGRTHYTLVQRGRMASITSKRGASVQRNCLRLSHGSGVAQLCLTLATCQAPLVPGDSPGKNSGVGCHFLLQWILLTQELNLGLLHCRQILYQLSYKGSPRRREFIRLDPGRWILSPNPQFCIHQEGP